MRAVQADAKTEGSAAEGRRGMDEDAGREKERRKKDAWRKETP